MIGNVLQVSGKIIKVYLKPQHQTFPTFSGIRLSSCCEEDVPARFKQFVEHSPNGKLITLDTRLPFNRFIFLLRVNPWTGFRFAPPGPGRKSSLADKLVQGNQSSRFTLVRLMYYQRLLYRVIAVESMEMLGSLFRNFPMAFGSW